MENIQSVLAFLSGLMIRLGLPLAITAVFIIILRKLDNRWKEEATESLNNPQYTPPQKPCWEVNQCTPEKMEACIAHQNPNSPCWQLFRSDQGVLKEKCLGCDVFIQAPLLIRH
jgi:hypothetical protein